MKWTERLGDTLYTFEGSNRSAATRRVIAIRSMTPLLARQRAARIPNGYRTALMASWSEENSNLGALEVVRRYVADPNTSLYLWGPVGVGKTWAVSCIANELLQANHSVRFQTVSTLLLELRSTFSIDGRSELDVLSPLFEARYLVLDELGDIALKAERRASEFAASRILTLLDRRWQDGNFTLMTSNLSLSELVKWSADERVGSRIRGICGEKWILELVGRDLRFDRD